MPLAEPSLAALPNPAQRYFLATRPAFLTVTLFAALIGLAGAWHSGISLSPASAVITVLFALVAHAGINVLNDYYDDLNGTDPQNTERVFPFTGGSRFIQNGVLTRGAGLSAPPLIVAVAGYALLVTNLLSINQFPDRSADEKAGKRHWVVRLGRRSWRGRSN